MKDTVFAIDLAKSVFQLAVSHHPGRVSKQYRLTRSQLLRFMGQQPAATVLMEACGSAHFWGRKLDRLGHRVRLLPVRHVAPYRTGNKTDRIDVEAMLEAGRNEKLCDEIGELERRMRLVEDQLETLGSHLPAVSQLRTVPGIGLLTGSAIVAFVGSPQRFPSGRHFASYLGLTPRERPSGTSRHLGRISKRGDTYLRMLLIHGARAVLCHAKRPGTPDALRRWALALEKKRGHNVAAVALANRIARIAWAIWSRNQEYREVNRPV